MPTDERIEARLTQAGERWRDAHAATAQVDFAAITMALATRDMPPDVSITPMPADGSGPRRHRARLWVAAAAAVAATVAAVLLVVQLGGPTPRKHPPPPAAGATPLVGTDWQLATMRSAEGTDLPVTENAPLKFDAHAVQGTDACNHLGGEVSIADTKIEFGQIATTEMACINRAAGFDTEVALLDKMLSGTVQWSITGDELTLTKPGTGTLVYKAQQHITTTDPRALVGPTWVLTTIQTGSGPDSVASSLPVGARIVFGGSSLIVAINGCPTVGYLYVTQDSGRMTLTDIGGHRMSCTVHPSDPDFIEFRILNGEVTWSVTGTSLTVTKKGVGSLVYSQDGAAPSATTDPKALVGVGWTLRRLVQKGADGTVSSQSVIAALMFDGLGGYRTGFRCGGTTGGVILSGGELTVTSARSVVSSCPSVQTATELAGHAAVDHLLMGPAHWSITDGQLTIWKPGVGALLYQRS